MMFRRMCDIRVPCGHHYFNRPVGFCWWCQFSEHISAMAAKFGEKWEEYLDSYKGMTPKELLHRLEEEMQELQSDLTYEEVIDVANTAMMLALRIKAVKQ